MPSSQAPRNNSFRDLIYKAKKKEEQISVMGTLQMLSVILTTLALFGCTAPESEPLLPDVREVVNEVEQPVQAELQDDRSVRLGHATFTGTDAGVQVSVLIAAAPEGEYRAQLHEFGSCKAPGFISAGKPYFGGPSNTGTEPRFHVSERGTGSVTFIVPGLSMSDVMRPGGSSVVIEELSDEGYGRRFACGVVHRITEGPIHADNLTPGGLNSAHNPDALGTGDGKVHRRPGDETTQRP